MVRNKVVRLASTGAQAEGFEKSETDHLVDEIRARIVSHTLLPGSRLRESQFAEVFKVSRARVRDAFGILEERGLIERIPNKGAVVMRLEADDIYDLFEVREVLEAQMVRLATMKSVPGDWDELIELFSDPLEKRVADNDLDAYMAAIAEFRNQCISAARNDVLKGLLDSIYDRVQGMTRRLTLVPGRALKGFQQHQEILQAMRSGDADRAETLKRENIRSAQEWFQKYQKYLL